MQIADLPLVNATLNGVAAVLLTIGYLQIRARRRAAHRAFMVSAFVASALFLISYTAYHAHAGSRPFTGHGPIRAVYFVILISHVVLAALVPPLALVTLYRAFRGAFQAHARLARWTLPIWLYVSVTGVVVYAMLYKM
jgi:uncharacterized membrane protein YozB (DUF420 family)